MVFNVLTIIFKRIVAKGYVVRMIRIAKCGTEKTMEEIFVKLCRKTWAKAWAKVIQNK